MGKASSSKKVAKAARAGGTARVTTDRKWGFPLAMAGIVVMGLVLIFFVRESQKSEAEVPPQLAKDHWHAAYGVYGCDTFLAPQNDISEDVLGIHTHGDGLIHIHPFSSTAAGAQAQLGVFADQVGLEFGDDSFTLITGESFATGDDCNGEPGVVRVLKWPSGDYTADPEVFDSDFRSIRFTGDGEAYTIFFGPESALDDPSALLPPSLATINELNDLEPGETAPEFQVPEDLARPSTSVPLVEGGSTTVAGDEPATTVASDPATTGG